MSPITTFLTLKSIRIILSFQFSLFFVKLQVRGAPAIGIAALLSLAVELFHKDVEGMSPKELGEWTGKNLDYLVTSRPTGVNLRIECSSLKGNFVSLTQ